MEREKGGGEQNTDSSTQNKKVMIQIPSYQEVFESSQVKPKQTQESSLFKPSQTFSQAFSFIKNSEFYSPPPPPPSKNEHGPSSSATTRYFRFMGFFCFLFWDCSFSILRLFVIKVFIFGWKQWKGFTFSIGISSCCFFWWSSFIFSAE